jgi:CheY-like chemotaxis protein
MACSPPILTAGDRILLAMVRPCFLVIDKQYPGSISSRKLVIETAFLNVLTAYSAEEAIQTLVRFPNVDGIVLDTEVQGMGCRQLVDRLRSIRRDVPIITVSPSGYEPCGGEQHHVSSYNPRELLAQVQQICAKESNQAVRESSDFPGSEETLDRV